MGLADSGIVPPMKYWETVADKLSAAGWYGAIAAPLQRVFPELPLQSLILSRERIAC
jgi:hypothetical protein